MQLLVIFALVVCVVAQPPTAPTPSCTANVMDFTDTASCVADGTWIVYGDLNIDNGKTLNVAYDKIRLDNNGSLNLLGEESTLRIKADLLGGGFGYVNITADANLGNGRLVYDLASIPRGNWYVYWAQFGSRSTEFGNTTFTYPAAELSCRQILGTQVRYDERSLVALVNITENESRRCFCFPQNDSCVDFNLPNPQSYIDSLCGQMPNMPGCSIQSICQNNQNLQSSQYCSDISILRTICTDMPMMKGCADFNAMCATNSTVKQCQTPIFTVPSTMGIEEAMTSICDSHHMDGCDKCPDNYDCDLLMVFGEMCYVMPKMTECASWATMCADSTAKTWPMCDYSTHKTPNAGLTNHVSAIALTSVIAAAVAF